MEIIPSVFDLHCHSRASDGTLTPTQLVKRAAANGVTHLSLTDHDTTAGIAEAQQAAAECGITLIPGIEISSRWGDNNFHILGLNIDPEAESMQLCVRNQQYRRRIRSEKMAEGLEKLGIKDALAKAKEKAHGGMPGRRHFAFVILDAGLATDMRDVFDRYLVPHRPGYYPTQWPDFRETIGWIKKAGGTACFAHPLKHGLCRKRLRDAVKAFAHEGGEAVEVVSGIMADPKIESAGALVQRLGLYASTGSDFHNPRRPEGDLGKQSQVPHYLPKIWSLWPETAELETTTA